MGDLELSLDDIIKKKLKKTDLKGSKNIAGNQKKPIRRIIDRNSRITKNATGLPPAKKARVPIINSRGQGVRPSVTDARNKIIQKQRQKMTDAREKLRQIAKQTDARMRLLKLREHQRPSISEVRTAQPRALLKPSILQRTVQSRMNTPLYEEEMMDYMNNVAYLNRNYSERPATDGNVFHYPFRGRQDAGVLYRTVENDLPHSRLYEEEKNYSWSKPIMSTEDDYEDIPVSRINSRVLKGVVRSEDPRSANFSWDFDGTPIVVTKVVKPQETSGILKRVIIRNECDGQEVKILNDSPSVTRSKGPTRTLSERFSQGGNISAQKVNLLKAKLETNQKNNNKSNAAEVQAPLGHRIVVSNLVPSVTHEDVKELFEDIGELISSKVVHPGTAEVVYKLHKDAVRAVDVYHNRQLDGQPMKCLLVNNRSSLAMASKSLKEAEKKVGKGVVKVDMAAFRKALHKKSTF